MLEGRIAIISFITVAEMRFGAYIAGWGARRLHRLDHELGRARLSGLVNLGSLAIT